MSVSKVVVEFCSFSVNRIMEWEYNVLLGDDRIPLEVV